MPFSTFWGPFETHLCVHTRATCYEYAHSWAKKEEGENIVTGRILGPPSQHVDSLMRFILSLSNFFMGTNLSYASFSHVQLQSTHSYEDFCCSIWVFLNCGFKAKWLIGNTLLVIMNFGRVLWVNWWRLIWCLVCQERSNQKILCKNSIEMATKLVIYEQKDSSIGSIAMSDERLEIWTKHLDKKLMCYMQCD